VSCAWYDIVGTFGVVTIIVTYILLQIDRLRSEQLAYSVINALGAGLILVSLYFSYNLPSVIVESFWLAISIFGVGKYLWQRHHS
jgi:hypothetical protein